MSKKKSYQNKDSAKGFVDDGRTVIKTDDLPDRSLLGLGFMTPKTARRRAKINDNGNLTDLKLTRAEKWAMYKGILQGLVLPALLIISLVFTALLLLLLWSWGEL